MNQMNKNEIVAYNYLLSNGYKEADIDFKPRRVIDFIILSTKERYEAKSLCGKASLVFTNNQLEQLRAEDNIIVVNSNKVIDCFKWETIFSVPYNILIYPDYYPLDMSLNRRVDLALKEILLSFNKGHIWAKKFKWLNYEAKKQIKMTQLKKERLKAFSVETTYKYGKLVYLTKAKNGKEALKNLIENSGDFNQILKKQDSNNMQISIEHLK